jgi:hypothetical protein
LDAASLLLPLHEESTRVVAANRLRATPDRLRGMSLLHRGRAITTPKPCATKTRCTHDEQQASS